MLKEVDRPIVLGSVGLLDGNSTRLEIGIGLDEVVSRPAKLDADADKDSVIAEKADTLGALELVIASKAI